MTPHRLGRPEPAEYVWGIDPGSRAAHFAFLHVPSGRFECRTCLWPPMNNEARRLMEARARIIRFAEAAHESWRPFYIACEKPIGRFPKLILDYCVGVTLEAVGTGTTLAPHLLSTTEWRKGIGVKNNKPAVVEWAKALGWDESTGPVDHAEALGVAVAASKHYEAATSREAA